MQRQNQTLQLSNNELIQRYKEELMRKIKLVHEEKNTLEILSNSLIEPILKFVEESTKKLNEIENSYYAKGHQILLHERTSPLSCVEFINNEIRGNSYVHNETLIKVFLTDLKRNKENLKRVISNPYFQNLIKMSSAGNEVSNQFLVPNPEPRSKIQSSIFPSIKNKFYQRQELGSNLLNNTVCSIPMFNTSLNPQPINNYNCIELGPNLKDETKIIIEEEETFIEKSQSEDSNSINITKFKIRSNLTRKSPTNSNKNIKIFTKNENNQKCEQVAIFSKKIKQNIPVRMIVKPYENSEISLDSDFFNKIFLRYFHEYFAYKLEDFFQIGGIVGNSCSLIKYIYYHHKRFKIESVVIYFFNDYACVLHYFRKGSKMSYSSSDLKILSEKYPECEALDCVRYCLKKENSTTDTMSDDQSIQRELLEEDINLDTVMEDREIPTIKIENCN